jgi:hypothetical protein
MGAAPATAQKIRIGSSRLLKKFAVGGTSYNKTESKRTQQSIKTDPIFLSSTAC